MTKFIGIIMVFICCIAILLGILSDLATAETYYCTSPNGLRVRFSPSKKANVEGYLEYGEEVEVYQIKGEWAEINFGDRFWCSVQYLSLTPPSDEPTNGTINSDGRVAVRSAPDGKRVGWVRNGDIVKIIGEINGWVQTSKGYISSQYVSIER